MIREDAWLAERLGRPAYSVTEASDLDGRPGFFQARVPTGEVALATELQAAGMRIVNTTVTLRMDPARAPAGVDPAGVADEPDPGALEVARSAFAHDRFHLDPAIPGEIADRIKHDWIDSYIRGVRGERLLVSRRDGRVMGFLAVLINPDGTHVIDLTAVAAAARNRGVGRELAARFLADAHADSAAAEVGTQAANAGATRFYERLGFVTHATAYDLHLIVE